MVDVAVDKAVDTAVNTQRRQLVRFGALAPLAVAVAACTGTGDGSGNGVSDNGSSSDGGELEQPDTAFSMPPEEAPHDATWMCFPGRVDVWGRDLGDVQGTIAAIGLEISAFEPVNMLVRPEDRAIAADLVGGDIELIDAPVDDLWARDTLPLFLVSDNGALSAARVQFNGWGDKQVHRGDATLAAVVADVLGINLIDTGVVGEGGGLENDGRGTLLATRSSWVNDNRNPGRPEADIADALVASLGAERLLWVDGVAGQDITDGHIDTLARFVDPTTIIHEVPAYVEPGETWYDLAIETADQLSDLRTLDGQPYELVQLEQPASTRRSNPEFLASYVNFYLCNGAVIMTEFGDDAADGRARDLLAELYPGRRVIAVNTDPVAAGGGGIHCATQQQPSL